MRLAALVTVVLLAFAPAIAQAQGALTQRVSGRRIATLAASELSSVTHSGDSDFVAASIVPDQVVAAGRVELHAGTPTGTSSFVNIPIEIDVDGREDRTVLVGYRVEQYIQTAVAAHDLPGGSVLSQDDVTMARVPYRGLPGNGVDALIGRKLNSSVDKGQPITIQATMVNQIVQAGSTVTFIVRDGGVAVTSDALARTAGGLGDQVFVYNPETRKALSGTVTAPNTVELDISGGDQ